MPSSYCRYKSDTDIDKAFPRETYPFLGPDMVEVSEEEIEDYVKCIWCDCKVPSDLATNTDAGWVCLECVEDN